MTIAIVGAGGFVGDRLVERWYSNGEHTLRPIVRSYRSLARLSRFDLDVRMADARDQDALEKAFAGCELAINSATGDADTITGSVSSIYRAANAAGVKRLVFLSSASVHGQNPTEGTDEATPLSDRQPFWYNNAKVQAEKLLANERKRGRTETVILRPGIVWGPRSRWVAEFAEALMEGKAYVVEGGIGIFNGIFVDNLIKAIELAGSSGDADGQAFLVQDAESVRWCEFYEPICNALGHKWSEVSDLTALAHRPNSNGFIQRIKNSATGRLILPYTPRRMKRVGKAVVGAWRPPADAYPFELPKQPLPEASDEMSQLHICMWRFPDTRAQAVLGYKPKTTFKDGLHISIEWLRSAGYPVQTVDHA